MRMISKLGAILGPPLLGNYHMGFDKKEGCGRGDMDIHCSSLPTVKNNLNHLPSYFKRNRATHFGSLHPV